MKNIIGSATWDCCEDCIHCQGADGDCDVPDDIFQANIGYDMYVESFICGCFKDVEEEE